MTRQCANLLAQTLHPVTRRMGVILMLFFGLLLPSLQAFAADIPASGGTIMKVANLDEYPVTPFITLLEDPQSQWTFEDVMAPALAAKFHPSEQDYLNFGYTSSSYWIRLELRYTDRKIALAPEKNWYLEIGKTQLNIAELYLVNPGGDVTKMLSDIRTPYEKRSIRHVNSVFPLTTTRDQTVTLYLHVKNTTAFYIPLTLWSTSGFTEKVASEEILYGIFYGGMLIMVLYNLFLFLVVRDASYIFYVWYLCSALVFEAIDMGHGAALLEEGGKWFDKKYLTLPIWSTWISSVFFTQHFLELRTRHPRINHLVWPTIIFSAIAAWLSFRMPYETAVQFTVHFCGYGVAVIPAMCTYAWYKGNKNALLMIYAWFFNVTGFMTLSSVATGVAPATPLMVASMPIGTFMEAVVLSFALAERIKQAQKDLLTARQLSMQNLSRYRSLVENAREGIYQLTLKGQLINANPAMAKILGFPSLAALISAKNEAVHKFFDDPVRQFRELAQKKRLRGEIVHEGPQGKRSHALHSAQLIVDSEGKPSHIEGTLIDITERRQGEQVLRERLKARREKEMAKAVTAAKSQFLKDMSYEIRTPLTAIIGFSESLRSDSLSQQQRQSIVATVTRNCMQLLQLINDILDFSKIEAGKMSVEALTVDIFSLINKIQPQLATMAREKHIAFNVDYRLPLPATIVSDPTRLTQILHNLCSNAIKFTDKGRVTLIVFWDDTRQQLCFSVVDTGVGLDAAQVRRLSSVDSTDAMKDSIQGIGLGIAISRRLTALLGGCLNVESTPGQGSCFTANITCKTPPRSQWLTALASPTSTESARTRNLPTLSGRVLLAEDNPVNQKLIQRVISKTGAQVIVADNGQRALEQTQTQTFDLILMDVNMPVMGGLEATRTLRQAGYTGPIYALTAEHGQTEIDASLAAGCNGHLTKPLEMDAFYRVLAQHLRSQEQPGEHAG